MQINFSSAITAADTESRILAGQIVPWGIPGNTSAGLVKFLPGSIENLNPEGIKLLREHSRTEPIGKAVELSATPGGIYGKFKLAQTTIASDILIEAQEGLREGFSIGATINKHKYEGEVMVVSSAFINEVSVVTAPAFGLDNAAITEIAASESEEVETNQLEEKDSMEKENAPAVEAAQEVPTVEAAQPKTAPIYTAPRVAPMSSAQYLEASVRAAMGDREAQIKVLAADDSTSTNTGLTLPQHMNGFITETFGNRPAIDAIGGTMALPSTGLSWTIPSMIGGTAPTVTAPGEGGTVSETGMTSDYQTITAARYAGMNTVSIELLERSQPNFGDLLIQELRKAYAKATDGVVLAALASAGTAATATAGSVAGLQSFIATEAPAAYVGTGGDYATELIASSAWWSELLNANDSADRPLFSALQPSNAAGQAGIRSANGQVFGANFWVDHNISTSGLVDNSAFLVARDAVSVWESPTTQLRVNLLGSGQVEIELYGYFAAKVLKPKGVRKFNLT